MESNNKSICIVYHYPCFDGAYAAINAYMYYKYFSRTKYSVSFYPFLNTWNQHDKLFHAAHNKIVFLDISISVDDINAINNNKHISLLIIDHHESNINE